MVHFAYVGVVVPSTFLPGVRSLWLIFFPLRMAAMRDCENALSGMA